MLAPETLAKSVKVKKLSAAAIERLALSIAESLYSTKLQLKSYDASDNGVWQLNFQDERDDRVIKLGLESPTALLWEQLVVRELYRAGLAVPKLEFTQEDAPDFEIPFSVMPRIADTDLKKASLEDLPFALAGCYQAGEFLAYLSQLSPQIITTGFPDESIDCLQWLEIVETLQKWQLLTPSVQNILDRVKAIIDRRDYPHLTHGNFVFGQILLGERQFAVIDWKLATRGRIWKDMGDFLGNMRRSLRKKNNKNEYVDRFISGFARHHHLSREEREEIAYWEAYSHVRAAIERGQKNKLDRTIKLLDLAAAAVSVEFTPEISTTSVSSQTEEAPDTSVEDLVLSIAESLYRTKPRLKSYGSSSSGVWDLYFDGDREDRVIKLGIESPTALLREQLVAKELYRAGLAVPAMEFTQEDLPNVGIPFMVMPKIADTTLKEASLEDLPFAIEGCYKAGEFLARLSQLPSRTVLLLSDSSETTFANEPSDSERWLKIFTTLMEWQLLSLPIQKILERVREIIDLQGHPHFIHKDFIPRQILVGVDRFAVIDWESANRGRIFLDMGDFLGSIRRSLRKKDNRGEYASNLIAGFDSDRPLSSQEREEIALWEAYSHIRAAIEQGHKKRNDKIVRLLNFATEAMDSG
jgi:aminoglycoside phosphotransferase (APT) family kinase protein